MQDKNYNLAKPLLEKYSESKKIPLPEVQAWFNNNKRIPTRTFQWYTFENLIPAPEFDGRNGFYSIDNFRALIECVDFLKHLKQCSKSQYSAWRKIFKKNKNNLRVLLDKVLILPSEYPIYEDDAISGYPIYSFENEQICLKSMEILMLGELDNLSIVDIEEEIKSKIAKKAS